MELSRDGTLHVVRRSTLILILVGAVVAAAALPATRDAALVKRGIPYDDSTATAEKELRELGIAAVERIPGVVYDPDTWWRTRNGIRIAINEYEKLLLDSLRHPLG